MKKDDIVLDEWQEEILQHDGDIVLCTGRQVGKTLTMSRKASEYMLNHPDCSIIIVSLTEDQAKLMIIMILDYFQRHHPGLIAKGKDKPTQNRIAIKNGSVALARPVGQTGDAVRGFTGDVLIIDEASKMPELVFASAKPVLLTKGGQIWMCSTPFGKEGYFWDSFCNKQDRFKVFHITSEKVMKDRPLTAMWTEEQRQQALNFLEAEKEDMSELQYGQEYLGLFLEDLRRFFDEKLIEQVCILKRVVPHPKADNYLGCDLARMGDDESSFEILHAPHDKVIKQIENLTTRKTLTNETETKIKELTVMFGCTKVGIDAGSGSLGVGIYDHLLNDVITRRKVVAMNNRAISMNRDGTNKQRIFKEDMYDNLKAMMEHGDILLLDDDNLKMSLRSVQYEFQKFKGEMTKVRIFGRYTHIAEGIIRASWLAKKEKSKKMFIQYI